jgi:hypothetical protein
VHIDEIKVMKNKTLHLLITSSSTNITPKCVMIHSKFHWILNEFEHFYHDEIGQPPSEWGQNATDNELVH